VGSNINLIHDTTKLFEQDGIPTLQLRIDVALDIENPLVQQEWLSNKIAGSINGYIHIKDAVSKAEEEEIKLIIPEYKKCPITGIEIDGVVSGKDAVTLRSKDRRGSVISGGKSKSKTLAEPSKYIDYNESYCTTKYGKAIDNIEKVNGHITVIL
jgi:hypothetical protein